MLKKLVLLSIVTVMCLGCPNPLIGNLEADIYGSWVYCATVENEDGSNYYTVYYEYTFDYGDYSLSITHELYDEDGNAEIGWHDIYEGTYSLDNSFSPAHIDLHEDWYCYGVYSTCENHDKRYLGIIRVTDEGLNIGYHGDGRPRLTGPFDSNSAYYTRETICHVIDFDDITTPE
jgi:hypothetical protein